MLSGQRAPHTFHPHTQTSSRSSRNRPLFCADRIAQSHTLPYRVSEKNHDTPSGTIQSLPGLQELAQISETMDSTSAELQSSHLSPLSDSPSTSTSDPTESLRVSSDFVDSSTHFLNSATTTRDSRNNIAQALTQPNQTLQSPNHLHKLPRQASSNPVQDIVRYLKTWRPPAEYYARRRYQHPSLLYPSRRPTLPSSLEERVTNDGKLVIVCPELAVSPSLRAYRRKIFPPHVSHKDSVSQRGASQGWDDDSDEDIENDFSDEDDSVGSDDDFDEAVTPMSSPPSNPTYFLQPLILTKPPGY